ncbi:MAG: CRISPR-associated helicase Cas3' [Bacteroidales bacterium]|nr:CRISPR-associated helicase Cas3' [Bacteroidales bacterium]
MSYYAHTKLIDDSTVAPEEEWQPLSSHLMNVAELASAFATDGLKTCAYVEGMLHDIGKYQTSFQERLRGSNQNVDHAVCGAKEATALFDIGNAAVIDVVKEYLNNCDSSEQERIVGLLRNDSFRDILAYAIIGHHSGLPNKGNEGENLDSSSLIPRLKKETEPYSEYKNEIKLSTDDIKSSTMEILKFFANGSSNPFIDYEFLIRYLYSCLVDADFLDTEKFCTGIERKDFPVDWDDCAEKIERKFLSFQYDTPVNIARRTIRDEALGMIKNNSHVYLLDMPTGSGKTLCSVRLALERIRFAGKKRIIYVIPYTSIIEQTAATMEELFPDLTILQHHCNYDFEAEDDGDEDISAAEKLKKATENWDVPMIITTNVQFFESIYSNRGKLRKMHNMADSVLIFDEMHMMPLKWFAPCMAAINELTINFGSEALFLTATMPDFKNLVKEYAGLDIGTFDLVPDKSLYGEFRNVTFVYDKMADVPDMLDPSVSNLVVCNGKKTALDYFKRYDKGEKYYLSTYMTPRHRSEVIDRIRADLFEGKKPAVFSTSLIEAGVDLDFDCAWRELSGLDNVLQTAGRCNREGVKDRESSKVHVFETDGKLAGDLAIRTEAAKGCVAKYGMSGISDPDCVREYYDKIYGAEDATVGAGRKIMSESFTVNFRDIADEFQFIESYTEGVVVVEQENKRLIDVLRHGGVIGRRELQKFTAMVNRSELLRLIDAGAVRTYDGVNVLESDAYYDAETGIVTEQDLMSPLIY